MRSLSRLGVLIPIAAACATGYGCSSESDQPQELGPRLEADTGVPWAIRVSEANKEIRSLSPGKPVRIGEGTPEQMARAFFDRYRDSLHGSGRADELHVLTPDVDEDGTTHLRFEHYLPGTNIPLLNCASTANFTKEGEAYHLQPGFRADLGSVATSASVSEQDAIRRAAESAASTASLDAEGRLVCE